MNNFFLFLFCCLLMIGSYVAGFDKGTSVPDFGVYSIARPCATMESFVHDGHEFTCEDLDEDE